MAEFPPPTALEREFFGDLFRDVDALVRDWGATQDALVVIARDPELAGLIAQSDVAAAEQRIGQLTRRTRAELDALRQRTAIWSGSSVQPAVSQGTSASVEAATAQGFQGSIAGGLGVANTNTIRTITEEIALDANFGLSSTERTMRRHFRLTQQAIVEEAAINEALLVSEARLENANQRRKRLAALFEGRVGQGQLIVSGGRAMTLRDYSDIVSRTRLAEAATEGAFQAALAMGVDTVRVSDHGRTDRFCDPFSGKVFSISGRDKRFPVLRERPPFHPRCRHALLPFVPELKTERELEFAMARSRDRVGPGVSIREFFDAQ